MLYFDILYNTHYASVTLGTDHSKSRGYINIAESMNKTMKPNQIVKGQRIYDYDNSFYMNISLSDMVKIEEYFERIKDPSFMENLAIFSDQSKSSYNVKNVKTKTLNFVCFDKNKQRLVDQNGNFIVVIFANINFLDGSKKYIDYKCSFEDCLIIKNWSYYCSKILPGMSAMAHEFVKLITGKDVFEYKKTYDDEAQYNNKDKNNYMNNFEEQPKGYSKGFGQQPQGYSKGFGQQPQGYSKGFGQQPQQKDVNLNENNLNNVVNEKNTNEDFIF